MSSEACGGGFFVFVCRYVATDIPSDLLVQVGGVNFHLHKVVDLLSSPNICFKIGSLQVIKYFMALFLFLFAWVSIPCFLGVER